jgi:5-methylcytosine-specific restriction endonuclease McrA
MAFSDSTKALAMVRANNQCECDRFSHTHTGRCTTKLTSTNTEYHHKTAVASHGSDMLSNCEVLCKTCHALIPTP